MNSQLCQEFIYKNRVIRYGYISFWFDLYFNCFFYVQTVQNNYVQKTINNRIRFTSFPATIILNTQYFDIGALLY